MDGEAGKGRYDTQNSNHVRNLFLAKSEPINMNWQDTAQISDAEDGGTRLNGSLLESGMGVQLSKP
jgi:hypothetical protein